MTRVSSAFATGSQFRDTGIGASIRVVVDETAESDIDALLMRADAQMYVAKRRNKSEATGHQLDKATSRAADSCVGLTET